MLQTLCDDEGMNQITSPAAPADQIQPRKKDAAARWRKLLEDQRASGLSVVAFCRERGIAASSLFAWRRRLLRGPEMFKPVTLAAEPRRGRSDEESANGATEAADTTCVELCLPGERRLIVRRGFDRQLLAEVIHTLEGLPSRLEPLP
jgi:transposase-like protein